MFCLLKLSDKYNDNFILVCQLQFRTFRIGLGSNISSMGLMLLKRIVTKLRAPIDEHLSSSCTLTTYYLVRRCFSLSLQLVLYQETEIYSQSLFCKFIKFPKCCRTGNRILSSAKHTLVSNSFHQCQLIVVFSGGRN